MRISDLSRQRSRQVVPEPPRPPGGTMDPEDPFYVERLTDRQATALVSRQGGFTCTIKGPRQIGKSSLLMRMIREAQRSGKQTVLLDFTTFDSTCLSSATNFYKAFAGTLAHHLGIDADLEKLWRRPASNQVLCTNFMERNILPAAPAGLLVGMDEVDQIADSGFSPDFFAMLRAWHNDRAMGSGQNLDMVLVTSTEPSLFIPNLNQSPFNVGDIVDLQDFTHAEVSQLNRLHGGRLNAAAEAGVYGLLSGHPGLTQLAVYYISYKIMTAEAVLSEANWDSGPFGDHLRSFLNRLLDSPPLEKAFQQVLAGKRCDAVAFTRLSGLGLVSGSPARPQPRCDLYRRYYAEHLRD